MKFELSQQIVDYTKHHISGSDLQPEIVKNKFALWDKVVEENLLSSSDEETRTKAILLLDDDTIYEYAFFENEDEKSFEYEAYQDIIAQCKYDFKDVNDPNRFVMFVASNQIGKLIRDSELVSTPTGWKKNGELKIAGVSSYIMTNMNDVAGIIRGCKIKEVLDEKYERYKEP